MARIARRPRLDPLTELTPLLSEFGSHRAMSKTLEARLGEIKPQIMAILERNGTADDRGSLWLEFTDPIAGFEAICRQRRSSVLLDTDAATQILREVGLYEQCVDVEITVNAHQTDLVLAALRAAGLDDAVTVTEHLSNDKIMAAYFAAKDTEDPAIDASDIDAMFVEKISWALVVKETT